MSLKALSYRVKIPLAITAVIVVTAIVVAAALISSAVGDARRDLEASTRNLAAVLARSLRDPMLRDDLWQAYEVIRTPLAVKAADNPLQDVVVLDADAQVFVASNPARVPVLSSRAVLPPGLQRLANESGGLTSFRFALPLNGEESYVAAAGPVLAED